MSTDDVSAAATGSTADLADEQGDAVLSCDVQFRQFGGVRAFGGAIATVECHEDNVLIREVLSEPGHGRVLVVDGGGSVHVALMGDDIANLAVRNEWAGIILYGAVRDTAALADIPLGIKALGSNARKSRKHRVGATGVDIMFGGITFSPGDDVFADDDGVVVIPATK